MSETSNPWSPASGTNMYLLAHSVGRPPANARHIPEQFIESWETQDDSWPQWIAGIERFRQSLGQLFNVTPDGFCPQTNLSSGLTKVLYSLPRHSQRNTLLLSEHDFPSMGFVFDRAQKAGYQLRFIPKELDHTDINVWSDHLSDDVACALVTHVHSNTSCQVPARDIAARCAERGIISIIDVCQSTGCIPMDLADWNADIVLGSSVKWLCGGPGAGFLWINPNTLEQLEPVDVGWFSHRNPMEFDIHNFVYAEGVLRFWGGTPSVLPFMLAGNSIAQLHDMRIDRIREHNLALTQILIDALPPETLVSPRAVEHRGGTLVLHFGEQQDKAAEALQNLGVKFDQRAYGMRLSPHIYNSSQEMQQIHDALVAL